MAGGTGGDVLVGMDGANTLDGGAGDDVLSRPGRPTARRPKSFWPGFDTNTFIAAVEAPWRDFGPLENW
ncbi:MAG: hypothetical protein R3D90_15040 [Paracoccaceae bacterium]